MGNASHRIDFLGIGAIKCATTWIFRWLRKHPQIAMPGRKELHFWNLNFHRGLSWYQGLFASLPEGKKRGEFTPSYAGLSPARIREIRRHFPKLRLLYIVRDPVDRAWSHACMGLRRSGMAVEEAPDERFAARFRSRHYIVQADYETCLRNWISVYPPEQLLLLRFESVRDEPRRLLKRCAEHIGVDPAFYDRVPESELKEPVGAGAKARLRPSLVSDLRSMHQERWRRFNRYAEALALWRENALA